MALRVKHTAFDAAHPAVPALFVAFTIGLTMFSLQPVLVVISLVGAFSYSCCVRGARASVLSLRWQLPLIALISVANPVFSASGSTEVFRVGLHAVYAESLWFGCVMGMLFVASALWFQGAAHLVPFDKVMALFGSAAPVVALMVSQCMRLIPRFARQGRMIAAVQSAATLSGGRKLGVCSARGAHGSRLRLTSVLMGWAMEDSLQTADAMRARGWGAAPRRTTYTRYRMTAPDAIALFAIACCGVIVAALAVAATSAYRFYPTATALAPWWGYAPYALWMMVPTALHIREIRRFA